MSHTTLIRSSFALLATAALLVMGCNKLKASALEDVIKSDIAKKGHPVKSVTCPEGKDFKAQTFDCSGVDTNGKALTFAVTIKPTEGDKADIRYVATIEGKKFAN